MNRQEEFAVSRQEEFAVSRTCQNVPERPVQLEETGKSKKTAQLCAEKKHAREGPRHGEWPLHDP
jgi:hypothetical protein